MTATAVVGARRAGAARSGRRAAQRRIPTPRPVPFPFPELAGERASLRAYRDAVRQALRTLAAAEQVYEELSARVEAHRKALAASGYGFSQTQTRGSVR